MGRERIPRLLERRAPGARRRRRQVRGNQLRAVDDVDAQRLQRTQQTIYRGAFGRPQQRAARQPQEQTEARYAAWADHPRSLPGSPSASSKRSEVEAITAAKRLHRLQPAHAAMHANRLHLMARRSSVSSSLRPVSRATHPRNSASGRFSISISGATVPSTTSAAGAVDHAPRDIPSRSMNTSVPAGTVGRRRPPATHLAFTHPQASRSMVTATELRAERRNWPAVGEPRTGARARPAARPRTSRRGRAAPHSRKAPRTSSWRRTCTFPPRRATPAAASASPPKSPPARRLLPTRIASSRQQHVQLHDAGTFGAPELRQGFAVREACAGTQHLLDTPASTSNAIARGGGARNPDAARRPTYLRAPFRLGGAPDARQRLGRQRRHLQVAAQDFFVVDVVHLTSPTAASCCHSARMPGAP